MYRVSLQELQRYLPGIPENDVKEAQVLNVNFQTAIRFGLLSYYYDVIQVFPLNYQLSATQSLNFYLGIKNVSLSCYLWISEECMNMLIEQYAVNRDLFLSSVAFLPLLRNVEKSAGELKILPDQLSNKIEPSVEGNEETVQTDAMTKEKWEEVFRRLSDVEEQIDRIEHNLAYM